MKGWSTFLHSMAEGADSVNLYELRMNIERERELLCLFVSEYGILDSRTLSKSQEIDILINQYNACVIENKKPIAAGQSTLEARNFPGHSH
ncbi:aspartyl-phosphate phosphatase Spo0E family protein [Paenibacillus tuaregi]|uniref:aspartyl-phosphate phosphatase Spo0E family protein n=1 Tax=Paenibacillus tuaregi TaxID=1816681 RepID=UPI000837D494|nr:aspartyl-phosphate phosphatase Spo0E family protein [Paenibacillus tuaregi]